MPGPLRRDATDSKPEVHKEVEGRLHGHGCRGQGEPEAQGYTSVQAHPRPRQQGETSEAIRFSRTIRFQATEPDQRRRAHLLRRGATATTEEVTDKDTEEANQAPV